MARFGRNGFGEAVCAAVGIDPQTVFSVTAISEAGKVDRIEIQIFDEDHLPTILKEFTITPKDD